MSGAERRRAALRWGRGGNQGATTGRRWDVRPGRPAGRGEAAVFRAALGLAVLLTAALVTLLTAPAGADAEAAVASQTLRWALRGWTALAWAGVVVLGLRVHRRR